MTGSNSQITLTWNAVVGLPSGVAYYNIYRDGSLYATLTTASFVDSTNITSAGGIELRHAYQVMAVNFDGVPGAKSVPVTAAPVGVATIATPASTSVAIQFTEPVDATSANNTANYTISGVTVGKASLQPDGYTVLLVTSALGSASHSLAISNVKTKALATLPTINASFTYAAGSYTVPSFTVGTNVETTNNASPGLTGTVSDPAASMSVRINGVYYAATNNGDGTWSLPQADVAALGPGTYSVVAVGVNASGVAAFDLSTNQLIIATAPPTATLQSLPASTLSPISSLAITFSEPVQNFTLQDLQFTLTTAGMTASLPLEGATLTSTNSQNWTLGNLSGLTGAWGTYNLTVSPVGGSVTDVGGNVFATAASDSWFFGSLTTTTVISSQSSINYGTGVTFTATVIAQSGAAAPTGSIDFFDTSANRDLAPAPPPAATA